MYGYLSQGMELSHPIPWDLYQIFTSHLPHEIRNFHLKRGSNMYKYDAYPIDTHIHIKIIVTLLTTVSIDVISYFYLL